MSAHPIEKALNQMNRKKTLSPSVQPYEKVTYDKLAELLGVSKQTVLNWKDDPSKMPFDKINELYRISGVPVQELMKDDDEKMPTPDVPPTYENFASKIRNKVKIAKKELYRVNNIDITTKSSNPFVGIRDKATSDLQNIISTSEVLNRKPRACALGQSDAGKSALANHLFGETIVPASYTPMTSAICGIHDISDRPSYLTGVENAVVFGRRLKEGEPVGKAVAYDDYQSEDCKKYIIRKGDHKSILNAYGTREGAYFENSDFCIDSIHIFVDNPLLKELDYYDVPGFGSGDAADDVSLSKKMYQSDIVFYLSPADAFLRGADISTLTNMLISHGNGGLGLQTIYIMATHANAVGEPSEVERILDKGIERIINSLTDSQLYDIGISRDNYSSLRKRCFAFDICNIQYCQKFNADFESLVPSWISQKLSAADDSLRSASQRYEDTYSKAIQNIEKDLSAQEVSNDEIDAQKKVATDKVSDIKNKLFGSIDRHKESCITSFEESYYRIVNEDYIVSQLKARDVKNKKDDINDFANFLCNKINDSLSSTMKHHSEKFKDEVNASIAEYSDVWKDVSDVDNINIAMNGFDFTRAFAAGLSGVTVYGALALWATVTAAGSNLGAYILVAKIVSALSAIGISVGGTAAAASTIASIGGPVVLGIVLSLIAAISVFGILTGNWRKRVAKKIIKAFEDDGIYGKCTYQIRKYWDDTKTALESCLKSMNDKTIKEYDTQASLRASKDKDALKQNLVKLYTRLIAIYDNLAS